MAFNAQLNIGLFPLALLLMLYLSNRKSGDAFASRRAFGSLLLALMLTLISLLCTWLMDGKSFAHDVELSWIFNQLYFLFMLLALAAWVNYICIRTRSANVHFPKLLTAALLLPAALELPLVLSNYFTHWLFYIDAANVYVRGPYYYIPYAAFFLTNTACTLTMLLFSLRAHSPERRVECRLLALFTLLPMPGMAVQLLCADWWPVWPLCALGALIIYVNVQNQKITTDPLTGLNNRGELDTQLHIRLRERRARQCLLLIDVDDFKTINDRFGHATGDEALCRVADVLRESFEEQGIFLARCGGDEFAVLADCPNDAEAEALCAALRRGVQRNNKRVRGGYALSLSFGYALSMPASTPAALYAAADHAMYAQKRRNSARHTAMEHSRAQ